MLLDGSWNFCFDKEDNGVLKCYYNGQAWGENKVINVLYCYQNFRLGIGCMDDIAVVLHKNTMEADIK